MRSLLAWIINDCSSPHVLCSAEGDSAVWCGRVLCCLHPNLRHHCKYRVSVSQGEFPLSACCLLLLITLFILTVSVIVYWLVSSPLWPSCCTLWRGRWGLWPTTWSPSWGSITPGCGSHIRSSRPRSTISLNPEVNMPAVQSCLLIIMWIS